MKKRFIFVVFFLFLISVASFALPPAFFDPERVGALGGGVVFSIYPQTWDMAIGFELYWISQSRFGVGLTSMVDLRNLPMMQSASLDALYYIDLDAKGYGLAVIPVKLRFGLFGKNGDLGVGLASGIDWYAVPFAFDSKNNMYVASQPLNSDFFLLMKGMAELDYAGGDLKYCFSFGADLNGTIGGDSGSGYTYIIVY